MRGALAVALCLAASASAETINLTLEQALARARASSPRLAQLEALDQAAAARVRGARAERGPTLDLAAGYTRNSHVPELTLALPGSALRTLFPDLPDNYRSRLEARLPLTTGGRLDGLLAAARAEGEAAALDLAGARSDLVLATATAYWQQVTARASERVLAQALAAYDEHRKEARDRADVGLAASDEVLAVEVQRERAELARLRSENQAGVASADLVRLLGLPPDTEVVPADALEDGEVETALKPEPEPEDTESLVATALTSRPERLGLAARLRAAEARVGMAGAARKPQTSLAAGYDYARPNREVLPPEDVFRGTWDVSVNLSLSLFDAGRTRAAVDEARAHVLALRAELDDLDRRIRLEVTSRRLDLLSARAGVAVAGRAVEAAREGLRVSRDRYRAGVIPSSERLDAESALLAAGLERTRARADRELARIALDRAVGR